MGNQTTDIFKRIPQGSRLSPTIFNIYTLALHGYADENTDIFQVADDFVIVNLYGEDSSYVYFQRS